MSKATAQNTIIGTISHSDTETEAGRAVTTIKISHTFWLGKKRVTTEYRFKFIQVAPNQMPIYREGMVVMVNFDMVRDEFTYKLKPTRITPLGEALDGVQSVVTNRLTGTIGSIRDGQYNGNPNTQIGIPYEMKDNGNITTTWFNFTFWRVPEFHEFLYQKGNVVTVDYHLVNKEDKYDIRPFDHLTLHKGQPKEAPASKKRQARKKTTA